MSENQAVNLSEVNCGLCGEKTVLSIDVQETMLEFLNQQEFEEEGEEGEVENQESQNEEQEEEKSNISQENSVQVKSSNSKRKNSSIQSLEDSVRREKDNRRVNNDSFGNINQHKKIVKEKVELVSDTRKKGDGNKKAKESNEKIEKRSKTKQEQINNHEKNTELQRSFPAGKINDKRTEKAANFHKESKNETHEDDEEYENEEVEASEFMSTFYCIKHAEEEYTYYNSVNKRLYCGQCLISEIESKEELSQIRPLKKCLPEILQTFQDMLNEIEVTKSLLENKRKDFEIRKESAKVLSISNSKKLELAFDELLDLVQEQKINSLKSFDLKNKGYLKELEGKEESIDERVAFFSGILEEVTSLRQNSETPEEELFVYFFGNQDRIAQALKEESNTISELETLKINKLFDSFSMKMKQEQMKQGRIGQESIREKIQKNIQSLTNFIDENEPPVQNSKLLTQGSEFPKNTLSTTKNGFLKQEINAQNVSETDNGPRYTNQLGIDLPEQNLDSKRMNTYTNSDTYNQFVEKVRALPSRPNNSMDVNKYVSQVRALSRGQTGNFGGDVSMFSKEISSASYYKTVSKNNYNLEKKMELEQKLRFFDLKNRKEETGETGYANLMNLTNKPALGPFQTLRGVNWPSRQQDNESKNLGGGLRGSEFKTNAWMFGK